MSGALSLLTSGKPLPPPVIALSNHTIASGGSVGNGVGLFTNGDLRALIALTSAALYPGEWVQSGVYNAADYDAQVFVINGTGHASSDTFATWLNLGFNRLFLIQTTGSFTLQIRLAATGVVLTPQVVITVT